MLLTLPHELRALIYTHLASGAILPLDKHIGANVETRIVQVNKSARNEATPIIHQCATFYVSAAVFQDILQRQGQCQAKTSTPICKQDANSIHRILVPPVVAERLFDGNAYNPNSQGGLLSTFPHVHSVTIDHRMCGCRSNSDQRFGSMHGEDCTSLICTNRWTEHLEYTTPGITNAYYQSYVQKCLLVHRMELTRYFAYMRKSEGIGARVDMRIFKGTYELSELCHLLVSNLGLEIVSDKVDCNAEAVEWFKKLFGLSRSRKITGTE